MAVVLLHDPWNIPARPEDAKRHRSGGEPIAPSFR